MGWGVLTSKKQAGYDPQCAAVQKIQQHLTTIINHHYINTNGLTRVNHVPSSTINHRSLAIMNQSTWHNGKMEILHWVVWETLLSRGKVDLLIQSSTVMGQPHYEWLGGRFVCWLLTFIDKCWWISKEFPVDTRNWGPVATDSVTKSPCCSWRVAVQQIVTHVTPRLGFPSFQMPHDLYELPSGVGVGQQTLLFGPRIRVY